MAGWASQRLDRAEGREEVLRTSTGSNRLREIFRTLILPVTWSLLGGLR